MPRYAENTKVPVERTRQEIERILERFGCDQFMSGWSKSGVAMLGFRIEGRMFRFEINVPVADLSTLSLRDREKIQRSERQRWRALLLVIKAKIEAVQSGIVNFEDEFVSHTVMADGQTFAEWARPQIAQMYEEGKMPSLMWNGPQDGKEEERRDQEGIDSA